MKIRSFYEEREKRITPGLFDSEFYKTYNYEESRHYKINHYPSERKPDYFRKVYKDSEILSPAIYSHHSRYEKINTMNELGKPHHVTNRLRWVIIDNKEDQYYTVTNDTVNRLDKISYLFYNTPDYWWAIAYANNIFDCFNVPRDKVLRIPILANITKQYFK